jgi:phage-related tail protein
VDAIKTEAGTVSNSRNNVLGVFMYTLTLNDLSLVSGGDTSGAIATGSAIGGGVGVSLGVEAGATAAATATAGAIGALVGGALVASAAIGWALGSEIADGLGL